MITTSTATYSYSSRKGSLSTTIPVLSLFARNLRNRLPIVTESAYPVSPNQPLEIVLESECPSHVNSVKASHPISRFSFDLAGVGSSAQEKLLEEKHRQKAKQRLRESHMSGMSNAIDDQNATHEEYSASEYDDMDS